MTIIPLSSVCTVQYKHSKTRLTLHRYTKRKTKIFNSLAAPFWYGSRVGEHQMNRTQATINLIWKRMKWMPDDRVSVIVSRSQLNVWVQKWKVLSDCRTTAVRACCDESESHSTRTGGHMCVSVAFNMIRRVDRKPACYRFVYVVYCLWQLASWILWRTKWEKQISKWMEAIGSFSQISILLKTNNRFEEFNLGNLLLLTFIFLRLPNSLQCQTGTTSILPSLVENSRVS